MAELENDDIDMLKELGSLTTANLMEKVRGLQNLAYQLGLDESREMTRGKFLNILEKPKKSQRLQLVALEFGLHLTIRCPTGGLGSDMLWQSYLF
ncbi:protein lin-52 homolog isoform X10 [Calonectris borealis]